MESHYRGHEEAAGGQNRLWFEVSRKDLDLARKKKKNKEKDFAAKNTKN
jgi:hypothetical protein